MCLRLSRRLGHFENWKGVYKLVAVEEAGHHALIVAEERETHDSGDRDAHPERPTTQAAGGRPHIGGIDKVTAVSLWGRG